MTMMITSFSLYFLLFRGLTDPLTVTFLVVFLIIVFIYLVMLLEKQRFVSDLVIITIEGMC